MVKVRVKVRVKFRVRGYCWFRFGVRFIVRISVMGRSCVRVRVKHRFRV